MKRILIAAVALSLAVACCSKNPVSPDDWHVMWIHLPTSTWSDQYVYFRYEGDPENISGVYRIPITGQGLPELVIQNAYWNAISPCGDKIVFEIDGRPWLKSLDSTNVADGAAVPLGGDSRDEFGTFGWLGCDTILYANRLNTIWMFDLKTGENKELYPWLADNPTGSRNGVISFWSRVGQADAILTIRHGELDTTAVFLDSFAVPSIAWPSISPDGRRILFAQEGICERSKDSMLFCSSINIIDAETGQPVALVDSGALPKAVYDPTWAAGGQVVYVAYQGNTSQLWVRDTPGSKRVLLTRNQLIDGLKRRKEHRP